MAEATEGSGSESRHDVEHVTGALDLLEVHDGARIVRIEGVGREAAPQIARGEHRQDGQQVGGDFLVVLAVVTKSAYLSVDHLIALVLRDVLLIVSDESHQIGAGRFRRPFHVAAMGIVQQFLHIREIAPAGAQRLVVVAAQ